MRDWLGRVRVKTLCIEPGCPWENSCVDSFNGRLREIRRRTRVVGAFSDGLLAFMLCAARLRHIEGTQWSANRYLSMERLYEQERECATESKSA